MNPVFRMLSVFLLSVLSGSVLQAKVSNVFYRSFWHPTYHGQRLSYCTLDGKECGLPVATRYCKMMGYDHADQEIIANNVGLTYYISSTGRCTGWRCNGFKTIRCTSEFKKDPPQAYLYRSKKFVFPHYNNYRIDWCYNGQTQCGKRAAYSFCRRMGYKEVKHFSIQKQAHATKALGNQKLCFGLSCNGFSEITCFR